MFVVLSIWSLKIQLLHTIFSNLGYPKYIIDQVFSAAKKKIVDTEESSATFVLPYNSFLKKFQRIMMSPFNTKLVFKYNNTISRSIAKMSPAPLEAEGGVYSVPNAPINIMERL